MRVTSMGGDYTKFPGVSRRIERVEVVQELVRSIAPSEEIEKVYGRRIHERMAISR